MVGGAVRRTRCGRIRQKTASRKSLWCRRRHYSYTQLHAILDRSPKARYTLPHYPCARVIDTARQHGPWTNVSFRTPVFTDRVGNSCYPRRCKYKIIMSSLSIMARRHWGSINTGRVHTMRVYGPCRLAVFMDSVDRRPWTPPVNTCSVCLCDWSMIITSVSRWHGVNSSSTTFCTSLNKILKHGYQMFLFVEIFASVHFLEL